MRVIAELNHPQPVVGPGAVERRNQAVWSAVNEAFTDADANRRWEADGVAWGLFSRPDAEIGALGEVGGLDAVELGCGTAFLAAGLARSGARPIAVDFSRAQLETAARHQASHGLRFPLVEAAATRVPLRAGSADLVVSEYGAAPWCEPGRWLDEAHRLLRPGGRLVFLTNSVLAGLCVPAEGGPAAEELLRPQRALHLVAWPGGGVEHHPGHGEWISALHRAGFVVDALHELYAPAEAATPEYYDIVTADWARKWPAEDLWVAHRR